MKREKGKKTKRQEYQEQKESFVLWRQGSFTLLRCFSSSPKAGHRRCWGSQLAHRIWCSVSKHIWVFVELFLAATNWLGKDWHSEHGHHTAAITNLVDWIGECTRICVDMILSWHDDDTMITNLVDWVDEWSHERWWHDAAGMITMMIWRHEDDICKAMKDRMIWWQEE